jgi:hypothetical protein
MRQIEQPVVIGFGWINSPVDPQTKHTSGGSIYFLKRGSTRARAVSANFQVLW